MPGLHTAIAVLLALIGLKSLGGEKQRGSVARPKTANAPRSTPLRSAQASTANKHAIDPNHQAAVDAAVIRAVREQMGPQPTPPPVPLVPELERDVPIVEPSGAEAHGAAEALRSFLVATKRFGNKKDRPKEISDAQSAMGLKPDGIVGPATRAAATKLGVKLPTR